LLDLARRAATPVRAAVASARLSRNVTDEEHDVRDDDDDV
jgi:hypothetical protein